ncbi:hypothetical protein CIK05_15000 [Bdellovibrio sp. qaytius]|nr:hypothetical protein CIK05_15000 [Bdellovibrio sp. qaytius]
MLFSRGKYMKYIFKINLSLIFLSILWGVVQINQMPESMPTHFGAQGLADGYSSKYFALLLLPLLSTLVLALLTTSKQIIQVSMAKVSLGVISFLSLLHICTIQQGISGTNLVGIVMPAGLSFLIGYLGWILPTIEYNYAVGIRLPWTLSSETNWKKTHQFAGKVFIAAGTVAFITSLFVSNVFVPLAALFIAGICCLVYSSKI